MEKTKWKIYQKYSFSNVRIYYTRIQNFVLGIAALRNPHGERYYETGIWNDDGRRLAELFNSNRPDMGYNIFYHLDDAKKYLSAI